MLLMKSFKNLKVDILGVDVLGVDILRLTPFADSYMYKLEQIWYYILGVHYVGNMCMV